MRKYLSRFARWDTSSLLGSGLLVLMLTSYIAVVYVAVSIVGMRASSGPGDTWFAGVPPWWLSLIAVALIAATILPVSKWLRERIHILLYAHHDNPYFLMTKINQQLQGMSSPKITLPLVVETTATMLHFPYVALEIQLADAPGNYTYGRPPAETPLRRFPIAYLDQPLGVLLVSQRAANQPLSEDDLVVLHDIAEQVGIALYVSKLTADLQTSRERLVIAREEERRRIRNDLHDGLAPALASFQLQLGAVRTLMQQNPAQAEAMIQELSEDLRQATGDIRRLVYDLRPPMLDELGLAAAIKHIQLSGSPLCLDVIAPEPMPSLPAASEVALYRIASEAIHNVIKHAQAANCVVVIEVEKGTLILSVTDDGKNSPASYAGGIGLQSMRERAAELGGLFSIQADGSSGTRIEVRLPLEE